MLKTFRCRGERAGRGTGERWIEGLRAFADQAQHIAVADAKYRAIDDEKGQQTESHMQVAMGGDGISSALYAIHHPGLTAHFGGDPACENGNQPGRAHPQGK